MTIVDSTIIEPLRGSDTNIKIQDIIKAHKRNILKQGAIGSVAQQELLFGAGKLVNFFG